MLAYLWPVQVNCPRVPLLVPHLHLKGNLWYPSLENLAAYRLQNHSIRLPCYPPRSNKIRTPTSHRGLSFLTHECRLVRTNVPLDHHRRVSPFLPSASLPGAQDRAASTLHPLRARSPVQSARFSTIQGNIRS